MLHKKSLGQHFLRDPRILQKIADAARLSPTDTVLEVGPGEGVLTRLLLEQAGNVIAVEKDDRLIPILGVTFEKEIRSGNLKLIHADILEPTTDNQLPTTYKIVANLPYYITGQFLRKFLQEVEQQPTSMTLLLQKEVAKRIVASDGKESILSISVKAYGTPRYIDTVKAGSFSPPPNVDSAILTIENISKEFFRSLICHSHENGNLEKGSSVLDSRLRENDGEEYFFALLRKGFAHPRKLLASNLGIAAGTLREIGIDEKARAETLSLDDWRRIAAMLL